MATGKKATRTTTTVVEEPIDKEPEQDLPPDPEPSPGTIDMRSPEDEDIREFLNRFGNEESRVKINKFDHAGHLRFLHECDIDSASETYIQENWGEGRYKLTLWGPDKSYLTCKTLHIGPGKEKPRLDPVIAQEPARETPVNGGMELVLQMMIEQNRQSSQLLAELIKAQGSGKSSAAELAEIMAILKAGQGSSDGAGGGVKLLVEVMPVVKEIISMASRAGSGGDRTWLDTIKDAAPDFIAAIKQMAVNKGDANAGRAMPPGQYVTPEHTTVSLPENNPPEEFTMDLSKLPGLTKTDALQLRAGIGYLKKQALGRKDPLVFVDFVLNTIDGNQAAGLLKILDRQYEDVGILDPDLLNPIYRPWFETFFRELKSAISESNNSDGNGGDPGELESDAGPVPEGIPLGSADTPAGHKPGNGPGDFGAD